MERDIHEWLKYDRVHGEWFAMCDELKLMIQSSQIFKSIGPIDLCIKFRKEREKLGVFHPKKKLNHFEFSISIWRKHMEETMDKKECDNYLDETAKKYFRGDHARMWQQIFKGNTILDRLLIEAWEAAQKETPPERG